MECALHPDLAERRAGEELGILTKPRMLDLTAQLAGVEDRADGSYYEVHGAGEATSCHSRSARSARCCWRASTPSASRAQSGTD